MLAFLQKNIVAQIVLLCCLFLVSFAGLKIGREFLEKRHIYLHGLLENEAEKVELSHNLQKNILVLNLSLYEMSAVDSNPEMIHILEKISNLKTDIADTLNVLSHGGKKVKTYPVSFGNKEIIRREINYINYHQQGIQLELIELEGKLVELDDIFQDFQDLVSEKITIIEQNDPHKLAGIITKVSNFNKGIAPFLNRMQKDSYRLLYESQLEKERIRNVQDRFRQTYTRVENISVFAAVVFILLTSGLIIKSSGRILLERQQFQDELLKANESLEQTIQERTAALRQQVKERQAAQGKILEQTNFLLNILESITYPFRVIDIHTYDVILANHAARQSSTGNQEKCYEAVYEENHPCRRRVRECPLELVRKTGTPVAVEHVIENEQGEQCYIEVHGYPMFDSNGALVQMIEYSLDITDKKKAESILKLANDELEAKVKERTSALEEQIFERQNAELKLIKSEQHYRRLIENISDIITIIDKNGIISYTSPSILNVLGVPPEAVIGHDIRELVNQNDLHQIDIPTLYERHYGKDPMEYRVAAVDGTYRVLESNIQKFQQVDNTEGYILSSRNISARKAAEEEMHKLQMVVEQSPNSVVITDTTGKIEYVNPAFEKITGYSCSEVIGKNPRFLKSGGTPPSTFEKLWQNITTGEMWRGEFINKKKNGELYTENVLVIPIRNLNSETTHFVAVKENITELKKARKQAEDANQAKSRFLSQMSHELRTPLNAINGFSQLMLKSKKNPLNEKQRNMTQEIASAGNHLLHLINEVLDLARIESGELALSFEPVDPEIVISDCISLTKPLSQGKTITVVSDYRGKNLPLVKGDLTRVKQILLNLLSNAVKYNHPNGLVQIDVQTDLPGYLRFVVADNGIGISPDRQKDIFTPFTRLIENPDSIEGTGIGMTITKQLVENMGGEIGFESELDQGSRFWFTLPVCTKQRAQISADSQYEKRKQSDAAGDKRNEKLVLYVEDNPTNIAFMREVFVSLEGFTLETASSGEEGIASAQKNGPDLILLDLNLPDISGFQVYRQLKATMATEFIPVIAVSADAMEKTVKKVEKIGFNGYLSKPVDIDILSQKMMDILEG